MREIPSPWQIAESPELAALHVLDAAVVVAKAALLASNPELEDLDACAEATLALSIDAFLADAVLTSLAALRASVGRYIGHLQRRSIVRPSTREDPF
jgi:hypothetical protein